MSRHSLAARAARRARVTSEKRIGRGVGSGLGKTSGRGQKGQKARSPGNIDKLHFQGGQTPMQRRLPEARLPRALPGRDRRASTSAISSASPPAPRSTSARSRDARLVQGQVDRIKILGDGELTKKLTVTAHAFSQDAQREDREGRRQGRRARAARQPRAAKPPSQAPEADRMAALAGFSNITKVPELRRRIAVHARRCSRSTASASSSRPPASTAA